MSNYDSNDITPAHLAEDDRVRVTYNSVYSDEPQEFEGVVTTVGGSFGSVTIDPHEDMADGEPRIYVLGNDVSVDTGYGDRRISDMTNPDITIEILNDESEEDDDAPDANAYDRLVGDIPTKGDLVTFSYDGPRSDFRNNEGIVESVDADEDDLVVRVSKAFGNHAYLVLGESDGYLSLHVGSDESKSPLHSMRVVVPADLVDDPGVESGDLVRTGGSHTYRVADVDDGRVLLDDGVDVPVTHITHVNGEPVADESEDDAPESETVVCTDGGFDELLDAHNGADTEEALSRDEVADLEDDSTVTLAYRTTQDTDKSITATVDKAWQGTYFAIAFLTTEDGKARTFHAYKSGRGTLFCEHDAPGGGRRLSDLSRAYIVRPEPEPEALPDGGREYPEPRQYRDLVESEETPTPLAEGEHVDCDSGVKLARLEGYHSEEFVVSAGTTNNSVVMDRDEIALLAELSGFEVTER